MRPGDRLICALVEPQKVGFQFKQWPLHVTIVPWFRLGLTSPEIAQELKPRLAGSHSFEVKVGGEEHFGYKQRKEVNLVAAPELMQIEGQTRRWLHSHKAWVVDEADKTRRKFRPHVTVQGGEKLHEGDRFVCGRLFIIQQYGDYKEIEAEIIL